MARPFIFKYTRIGSTCFVDDAEMERLFRKLRRLNIDVENVKADSVSAKMDKRQRTRLPARAVRR